MKIPHDMQLVEGDVVTITAHVTISSAPGQNRIFLAAGDKYGPTVILDREHVDLVTTSIRVGDEVTHLNAPPVVGPGTGWDTGIVVAIASDEAWITWNASGSAVWGVSALRRTRTHQQIRDDVEIAPAPILQAAE